MVNVSTFEIISVITYLHLLGFSTDAFFFDRNVTLLNLADRKSFQSVSVSMCVCVCVCVCVSVCACVNVCVYVLTIDSIYIFVCFVNHA